MKIKEIRNNYHKTISEKIIRFNNQDGNPYPNFADGSNNTSVLVSQRICDQLATRCIFEVISVQTVGNLFETISKEFIQKVFNSLGHIRPGSWQYSTEQTEIMNFEQYEHLSYLKELLKTDKNLNSILGSDYIVKPDIVVFKNPISDEEIEKGNKLELSKDLVKYSPLRENNHKIRTPILHASISCKWTIRSDRSQNTRTEALNLIRNRKGNLPHIMVVTAEPLPSRIAALALGTGDIDCVYHFALFELLEALREIKNQDQLEMLEMMVEGKRLRDISDLPFDLAI